MSRNWQFCFFGLLWLQLSSQQSAYSEETATATEGLEVGPAVAATSSEDADQEKAEEQPPIPEDWPDFVDRTEPTDAKMKFESE